MVFDGDTGGEEAALRGLKLLKDEGCRVNVAELPSGMDPADFILQNGAESFRRDVLDKARSLVGYKLFSIKKKKDLKKEEDRLHYWTEARKILADLTEPLERDEYLKKIAGEIGTSLEVLRGDLEKSSLGSRRSLKRSKGFSKDQNTGIKLKELAEKELSSVLQDPA